MRLTNVGTLCGQITCLILCACAGTIALPPPPDDKPQRGQAVGTTGGLRTPATSAGIIDRSVMLTGTAVRQGIKKKLPSVPFIVPEAIKDNPRKAGEYLSQALNYTIRNHVFFLDLDLSPTRGKERNLFLADLSASQSSPSKDAVRQEFIEYVKGRLLEKRPGSLESILRNSLTTLELELQKPTIKQEVISRESLRLQAVYNVVASDFLDKKYRFASQIVNVEEQVRVVGEQNYFATNVHYGNAKLRSDFSAQYITGSRVGFGFAFHYDLNGFSYDGIKGEDTLKSLALPAFEKTAKQLLGRTQEDARLVRHLLSPQAGLTFDYRHLYGTGDLYGVGLGTSLVSPLTCRSGSQAFYSSVGFRYSWLEQKSGLETPVKGLGFSAVLAWQDASPSYQNEPRANGRELTTTFLNRWHRRIGVEFAQRNAIVQGDYGALFLRFRDRTKGEYTLLVGSEANGAGFVGFNTSTYFAW